jgi:hypothetical protein
MGPHNEKTEQFPKDSYVLSLFFKFFKSSPIVKEGAKKMAFFELPMPPPCK